MTEDDAPCSGGPSAIAAATATDAGVTSIPRADATPNPTTDAHPQVPASGKEDETMQLRPAPGRDLRERPATRRGQLGNLGPDQRWARIAIREQRRATFWRALLDQYIESLEREANERQEQSDESGH